MILIDWHPLHSSSERLPVAAEGTGYRDPSQALGIGSRNWGSTYDPPHGAREISWKSGGKMVGVRGDGRGQVNMG